MYNATYLTGLSLGEAIKTVCNDFNKIIKIIKITGNNSKFNKLENPYVIKSITCEEYITLFVTYY